MSQATQIRESVVAARTFVHVPTQSLPNKDVPSNPIRVYTYINEVAGKGLQFHWHPTQPWAMVILRSRNMTVREQNLLLNKQVEMFADAVAKYGAQDTTGRVDQAIAKIIV